MALASGEARKDLSADALFGSLRSRFASLPDLRSGEVEIPLADALMSAFAMFSLKDPSLLAFDHRRHNPKDNFRTIYGINRVPCDFRCGTSWILSIPRTCGPRSARSSVACNAARCSNASSIWTAITCCRWTAPPISPPPRSIVPPVWKSTIATAASPIPINCWGPPWSIPTSRKSSRWHPSRSSSRTVKPRTTASGTPPAAGSNGFARSIPTCRSSSSKTPSRQRPPPSRPA